MVTHLTSIALLAATAVSKELLPKHCKKKKQAYPVGQSFRVFLEVFLLLLKLTSFSTSFAIFAQKSSSQEPSYGNTIESPHVHSHEPNSAAFLHPTAAEISVPGSGTQDLPYRRSRLAEEQPRPVDPDTRMGWVESPRKGRTVRICRSKMTDWNSIQMSHALQGDWKKDNQPPLQVWGGIV